MHPHTAPTRLGHPPLPEGRCLAQQAFKVPRVLPDPHILCPDKSTQTVIPDLTRRQDEPWTHSSLGVSLDHIHSSMGHLREDTMDRIRLARSVSPSRTNRIEAHVIRSTGRRTANQMPLSTMPALRSAESAERVPKPIFIGDPLHPQAATLRLLRSLVRILIE